MCAKCAECEESRKMNKNGGLLLTTAFVESFSHPQTGFEDQRHHRAPSFSKWMVTPINIPVVL